MLKFISFSSGSCGNCYYLGDGRRGLLIDAGISCKTLKMHMFRYGLTNESFQAVLLTHAHVDHISGLRSFCNLKRGFGKPVYTTAKIHSVLACHTFTKDFILGFRRFLNEKGVTEIGDFKVRWFEVPHDACQQTVGYQIEIDGYKFFLMTDSGHLTEDALQCARESSAVVIESNYDEEGLMSADCKYDPALKARIASGVGHLSNTACAQALREIWHPGLQHIYLCHRSANSNTEERALAVNRAALEQIGAFEAEPNLEFVCLRRSEPTGMFTLQGAEDASLEGNLF